MCQLAIAWPKAETVFLVSAYRKVNTYKLHNSVSKSVWELVSVLPYLMCHGGANCSRLCKQEGNRYIPVKISHVHWLVYSFSICVNLLSPGPRRGGAYWSRLCWRDHNSYILSVEDVWPNLYSKLLLKLGQEFLDIQYPYNKECCCKSFPILHYFYFYMNLCVFV